MPILPPWCWMVFWLVVAIWAVALCVAAARGDRAMEATLDEEEARERVRPLSSALSCERREIARRMRTGETSETAAAAAAQRTARRRP